MDNQRSNTPSDEIDLGKLFNKLGEGFAKLWMAFMRLLAAIRRVPFENKLSFALIITASIGLGVTFAFFVRKNFYESKMILSSDYLNKRLAENTIDKLNLLAQERNKSGLAKTLGLPDSLANNIIGFSVVPFVEENDVVELEVLKEQLKQAKTGDNKDKVIDEVIERIEIENRHAFEITVRTLNPSVITNLQQAIVGHFEQNPYIQKRIEINRRNLTAKVKKLGRDVEKLDSLKRIIYENYRSMAEQPRGSNNVIMSDKATSEPVDIYNQDQFIYHLYQEATEELYLRKDFEVVDGFTEFSEPASISIATMIFYSLLIGIGVAYLDVALRDFNKYLSTVK
jgi:hypothetical protein